MHELVRNVTLPAAGVPGLGAVVKDPVRLFESEYVYRVDGLRCSKCTGHV